VRIGLPGLGVQAQRHPAVAPEPDVDQVRSLQLHPQHQMPEQHAQPARAVNGGGPQLYVEAERGQQHAERGVQLVAAGGEALDRPQDDADREAARERYRHGGAGHRRGSGDQGRSQAVAPDEPTRDQRSARVGDGEYRDHRCRRRRLHMPSGGEGGKQRDRGVELSDDGDTGQGEDGNHDGVASPRPWGGDWNSGAG